MLRNRVRRPFTVEAKASGQTRSVTIPSKQPQEPRKRTGQAEAAAAAARIWSSLEAAPTPSAAPVEAHSEHRRILPSLLVVEVPEPEPEPVSVPEELFRVRRVPAPEPAETAPRRRGRPRKDAARTETALPPEATETPAIAPVEPDMPEFPDMPEPMAETASPLVRRRRPDRTGSETLRLGERWKRRLPRVCW
ncbi:DNA-binding protein [Methylorubrum populi]